MRIVSLVPSMTETLLAWGIVPSACTRFCEQPTIAHVGGTKDPDIAAIVTMAPDLVIVDAEENRRQDHDALVVAGLDVHVLRIRSIADVAEQLVLLAARLGVVWSLPAHRLDLAAATSSGRSSATSIQQPIAFVPIWKRPWMALGTPTYGSSLLAELGIANAVDGLGAYPEVTLEQASELGTTMVIAPSEPYPFTERHRGVLEAVAPTYFIDGRDLLWWGARTGPALERLAIVLRHG